MLHGGAEEKRWLLSAALSPLAPRREREKLLRVSRRTPGLSCSALPPEREPSWARSASDCIGSVESGRTCSRVGGCCEPRTARAPFALVVARFDVNIKT